jgi:hypothetical protein
LQEAEEELAQMPVRAQTEQEVRKTHIGDRWKEMKKAGSEKPLPALLKEKEPLWYWASQNSLIQRDHWNMVQVRPARGKGVAGTALSVALDFQQIRTHSCA